MKLAPHESPITRLSYHFVPSTDENRNGSGIFALLNDQHPVFGGAKADLLHKASTTQLLWGQLTETWHNSPAGCNGDELQ